MENCRNARFDWETKLTTNELYDMLEIQAKELTPGTHFKFRSGTTINKYIAKDSSNRLLYVNLLTSKVRRIDLRKKPDQKVLNISHIFVKTEIGDLPF